MELVKAAQIQQLCIRREHPTAISGAYIPIGMTTTITRANAYLHKAVSLLCPRYVELCVAVVSVVRQEPRLRHAPRVLEGCIDEGN
jgi:hypothetical protein